MYTGRTFICAIALFFTLIGSSNVFGMQDAAQALVVASQQFTCPICQETVPHATQTDVLTLACSHQTHKQCLEKYFRSKLIENDEASLACTLCRAPLTDTDKNRLDLSINDNDLRDYLKARTAPLLHGPVLTGWNSFIPLILSDPRFIGMAENVAGARLNREALSQLEAPLTRQDLDSGRAFRKILVLGNLLGEDFRQDLIQYAAHLVQTNQISTALIEERIGGFTNNLLQHMQIRGRMSEGQKNVIRFAARTLIQEINTHIIPPLLQTDTNGIENNRIAHAINQIGTIIPAIAVSAIPAALVRLNGCFPLQPTPATLRLLHTASHVLRLPIDNPEHTLEALNRAFPLQLDLANLLQTITAVTDFVHNFPGMRLLTVDGYTVQTCSCIA